MLIEGGAASIVDEPNSAGLTPVLLAAVGDWWEAVETLLIKGANPNIINKVNIGHHFGQLVKGDAFFRLS